MAKFPNRKFLTQMSRFGRRPVRLRSSMRWSSWTDAIRRRWSRRLAGFRTAWGLLPRRPAWRLASAASPRPRPWGAAEAMLRLELGPFVFTTVNRPLVARRGAAPLAAHGREPRPGSRPFAAPAPRMLVAPRPVRALLLGARDVARRELLPGIFIGSESATSRAGAPPPVLGRARVVAGDSIVRRAASSNRSAVPPARTGTLLITRRLIEERTRREMPSMVAPRPLLRGRSDEAASASRRAAPFSVDEPARRAGERANAPRPPEQPVVSQLDVERLTDQVVRRIDERILAYRERMGKAF